MVIVGGSVWLGYLIYANALSMGTGIPHLIPEITGIPFTWVANYGLNARFNFRQPPSLRHFAVFCSVSAVGWVGFIATSVLVVDVLHGLPVVGTVLGVGTKTAVNLLFQQVVTFGVFGQRG